MPRKDSSGSKAENAIAALEVLQDTAKIAESIPYLEGIAGILTTILTMRRELDQCDEEWSKAMEGVEKIKNLILKFVGPISQRTLPSFVAGAFEDLKTALDEFQEVVAKYKATTSVMRFVKRKALRDDARSLSDTVWKAVKLFETDLAVENTILVKEIHTAIVGKSPDAPAGRVVLQCPTPSSYFTGRGVFLERLISSLSSPGRHVVALVAKGGAGKTQVTLKYGTDNASRYSRVLFIDASSGDTLTRAFKTMAEAARVGDSAVAAINWLMGLTEDWLMIMDNADDPGLDLGPYLPRSSHARIIITSRNEGVFKHASRGGAIKFPDLDDNDAVDLLLLRAHLDDTHRGVASQLVNVLGCHALAVAAAGAYIGQLCTIEQYLDYFKAADSRPSLLNRNSGQSMDAYTHTVYATFALSFEKLSDSARRFMHICSYFHHASISAKIFQRAAKTLATDIRLLLPGEAEPIPRAIETLRSFISLLHGADGCWSSYRFHEIIDELQRFSLVSFEPTLQAFSIHPLLHSYTQDSLSNATLTRFLSLHVLAAAAPEEHKTWAAVRLRKLLIPHVDIAWQDDLTGCTDFVCDHMAPIFFTAGHSRRRFSSQLRAVELRKEFLGETSLDTLVSMRHLAVTYVEMGQFSDAKGILTEAFEGQMKSFGESHPHTVHIVGSLAWIHWQLGNSRDATSFGERAVAMYTKVFGESHLRTRKAMSDFGRMCWDFGARRKAINVWAKIVNDWEAETDPMMQFDLSQVLLTLGRYEEAELLALKAFEFCEKGLGKSHPDTLDSLANIAVIRSTMGRTVEAEAMHVKVLEFRRAVLGEHHPNTLRSVHYLADIRWELGHRRSAADLMASAVQERKYVLGPDHQDTIRSECRLRSMQAQRLHSELST